MIKEKGKEALFELMFLVVATISILCVITICLFLFATGIPAIAEIGFVQFIFGTEWQPSSDTYGIFPMIVGSIYITGGAVLFGVPVGVLTAIYMTNYCPAKLYKILKPAVNLMAGIPSIIYGFFGMTVLVPAVRDNFNALAKSTGITAFYSNGSSILTASFLLGFMILPTIINISESALRAVPSFYYEGARALGATHEQAVFKVVLPAAKSGVFASLVLGIGRAIGETMAVILVAGNQPRLTGNILQGIRTLTANVVMEMSYAADLHADALVATGVVLFVFILIINMSFSLLQRRNDQ